MKDWSPRHVIALAAIIGATVLVHECRDGWGWLIFAAIMIG